jgi:hypothetical protein
MKKAKMIFALLMGLIVVIVISFADVAEANPKPYRTPTITIFSPIQDQTYYTSNIVLNVSLNRDDTFLPFDIINSLNYSLDGQKDKPLPYTLSGGIYCHGKITLSNLSDGPHSIFVHSEAKHESEMIPFNATVSFTVETVIKPVNTQIPTIQFLLHPIVIATITITVIISCIMLGYFIRRKKLSSKQSFL